MFVIVQCWNNLESAHERSSSSSSSSPFSSLPLSERMGRTMRHAGVAVTVTSLTDVFAFGVGAVTVSQPDFFTTSEKISLVVFFFSLGVANKDPSFCIKVKYPALIMAN